MLRRSSRLLAQASLVRNSAKTFCASLPGVVHDADTQMFYIKIGNEVAFIQYDRLNSVLDLSETEVPPEFRNKGVAAILAKAAFDHVVKNDLKMKVTCTYLQDYLNKNPMPEYLSRVVE